MDWKIVCEEFKKIANQYMKSQSASTKLSSSFFRSTKQMETVADELYELIVKAEFNIGFPKLSHQNQIDFLEKLRKLYLTLMTETLLQLERKKHLDDEFVAFSKKFKTTLKSTLSSLYHGYFKSMDEVNLNYLTYYLDALSNGMASPTNYDCFRNEIIVLLRQYINKYPHGLLFPLVNAVFNTVYQDNKSINLYATNMGERFLNILKFINPLRHSLINDKDNSLLPQLTEIMDKALDVTRPNQHRTHHAQALSRKTVDIIDFRLAELDDETATKIEPPIILSLKKVTKIDAMIKAH